RNPPWRCDASRIPNPFTPRRSQGSTSPRTPRAFSRRSNLPPTRRCVVPLPNALSLFAAVFRKGRLELGSQDPALYDPRHPPGRRDLLRPCHRLSQGVEVSLPFTIEGDAELTHVGSSSARQYRKAVRQRFARV